MGCTALSRAACLGSIELVCKACTGPFSKVLVREALPSHHDTQANTSQSASQPASHPASQSARQLINLRNRDAQPCLVKRAPPQRSWPHSWWLHSFLSTSCKHQTRPGRPLELKPVSGQNSGPESGTIPSNDFSSFRFGFFCWNKQNLCGNTDFLQTLS